MDPDNSQPPKSSRPSWGQILLMVAGGFLLAFGFCAGAFLTRGNVLPSIFGVLALASAVVMLTGVVFLIVRIIRALLKR